MKVLITSGGTKVALDSVRSITNMSRGTFGSKIGTEILLMGYNLTFLHAEGSKTPVELPNCSLPTFVTFDNYAARLDEELKKRPDIIILAAAISDYGVEKYVDGKISSNENLFIKLALKPLPKLISKVREKCPKSIICGFKLLVNSTEMELCDAATKSLVNNHLDLVIGNDLRDIKAGEHKLMIVENKTMGIIVSVHRNNLDKVVVDKCIEHYERNTK